MKLVDEKVFVPFIFILVNIYFIISSNIFVLEQQKHQNNLFII